MPYQRATRALIICCALVLGACGAPTPVPTILSEDLAPAAEVGQVVINAITANTVLGLWGSPQVAPEGTMRKLHVEVYTANAQSPQTTPTGISTVNLTADGKPIGSLTFDPTLPSASGDLSWMPPALPGGGGGTGVEYTIEASTPGVKSAVTQLCVVYSDLAIDYLNQFGADPCTPFNQPSGPTLPTLIGAEAKVESVSCHKVRVEFNIKTSDPDHNISYAFIELKNADFAGGGKTYGEVGGYLTQNFFFYAEWTGANLASQFPTPTFDLIWTAKVVTGTPMQVLSSGPQTLKLNIPFCVEKPDWPFEVMRPNMPEDFPAFIPRADADCPSGTYFAPGSKRCTAIQIPEERQGEGGDCPAGQSLVCSDNGIMVFCSCQ